MNRLDKNKNEFKRYYINQQENKDKDKNKITSLCLDQQGTLWIGAASEGLFAYIPQTDSLKNISAKELKGNWVNDIIEKDNKLYIASYSKGLLIYDLHQQQVVRSFQRNSESLPLRPTGSERFMWIEKEIYGWETIHTESTLSNVIRRKWYATIPKTDCPTIMSVASTNLPRAKYG